MVSLGAHGEGLPFHAHNKAMLIQLHGEKVWHFVHKRFVLGQLPVAKYRETLAKPAQWSETTKSALMNRRQQCCCNPPSHAHVNSMR